MSYPRAAAHSDVHPLCVRTPQDDCPPYDPTLWGGRDCFILTKLLASPDVRGELAERGWAGDLNPIVNRQRNLGTRPSKVGSSGSHSDGKQPSFLAPKPPSVVERVRSVTRIILFFFGLIPNIELSQAQEPMGGRGWFAGTLDRILWGLGRRHGEVGSSAHPPLEITPTDNLQERLNIALGVGDSVAASHIAAELARRRATLQRADAKDASAADVTQQGSYASFWRH